MLSNTTLGRREWLAQTAQATVAVGFAPSVIRAMGTGSAPSIDDATRARVAIQAERIDPDVLGALAQRAVDAARSAGATYADARLTRMVYHNYWMVSGGDFFMDEEVLGVGVRTLVNGYWGFAASPFWEPDEVVQLARDAVAQAKDNALGTPRTVDLGQIPIATGAWETPIRIDPFSIPVEEKLDYITYWQNCAAKAGMLFTSNGLSSYCHFVRHERVVATSEGALFSQTLYESGGVIDVTLPPVSGKNGNPGGQQLVSGIAQTGRGWEIFLDAKIPEQLPRIADEIRKRATVESKEATIGRYPLVCDGGTMASLVDWTWGVATQLDRALGYEANASGTSTLRDPLAMLGQLQVASPLVTISANRSVPAQLATVKWDDEGVAPDSFPLIRNGVLVDFQTTREQAAWLAPYYNKRGKAVRSHGCAASENALAIPMQHMPNLVMDPTASAVGVEDLIATIDDGIFVENGSVVADFQAAGGMIFGDLREIKHGRPGKILLGGAVLFNTVDLWKNVSAVAGASSHVVLPISQYGLGVDSSRTSSSKGQPKQNTSHSVSAVAAAIQSQPLINPGKRA